MACGSSWKASLAADFEHQSDRLSEIGEAVLFVLTLAIGTWNFQAGGPKAALVRFAAMEDGGVVFHSSQVSQVPGLSSWQTRGERH